MGGRQSCTVLGLAAAKAYQFQLVAFRGTLNVNAVLGGLSNPAAGSTLADPPVVPVASVTVSPAPGTVPVGQTLQLTAAPADSGGNLLSQRVVPWASSTTAVATVSGSGLVSGLVTGTVTITATSGGASGSSAISVTATKPGTGSDLALVGTTYTSVTLSFTDGADGTGR